jgi:hypothetical protein
MTPHARYIDALPNTMLSMLEEIHRESGLIGSVFLAGGDPSRGGTLINIVYVSIVFPLTARELIFKPCSAHSGETPIGGKFGKLYPDAVSGFKVAQTEFVSKVYSTSQHLPSCDSIDVCSVISPR